MRTIYIYTSTGILKTVQNSKRQAIRVNVDVDVETLSA